MLKIRKIMGRELPFVNGYYRVQIEMDKILENYDDIEVLYHYYQQPKNIIDHFIKRLIKYPRFLRKTENKDTINHIIVQHLSDLARKLNPDRTIIHLLDIWDFINPKGYQNSKIVNKLRLKGLRNCKHIIAISEFTKQEAIEKLGIVGDRITVIKCGVNRDVFYPIEDLYRDFWIGYCGLGEKNILYVGTESGRKDFPTLLKAFHRIRKTISNIKLIRVGKPEYEDGIKWMGLEDDIIYLSNIPNNVLNILYNVCDMFVFPSIYEGYGLPAMEANSTGCPLTCSNIPVFEELHDYSGSAMFFEPQNYIELSDLILDVLNKETLLSHYKKRGILNAKENTWEKSTNQYLSYIKQRFS